MYDAALGRWWLIDPKSEKYFSISPYNYGDNNPIKNIDVFGKDIFDINGNLIESDNTNIIRIQTKNGLINLSAFPMNNMENRKAAANIALHYGYQVGIYAPGYMCVGNNSEGEPASKVPAYTVGNDTYINARGGGISKDLDNVNNMKSVLFHEKLHKDRKHGFLKTASSNLEHAKVYLEQMQDETFENTTNDFKAGMIGSISKYIKDAAYELANKNGDLTQISGLIKSINELSKTTGYIITLKINYNESTDPSMFDFSTNIYQSK